MYKEEEIQNLQVEELATLIQQQYAKVFEKNPYAQHKIKEFNVLKVQQGLIVKGNQIVAAPIDWELAEDTAINIRDILKHYLGYASYIEAHPEIKQPFKTPTTCKLMEQLVNRLAKIDAYLYLLLGQKENVPEIKQLFKYNGVRVAAFTNGILFAYKQCYIEEHTKQAILRKIPKQPKKAYPQARNMFRHFIINVGGTNTGKTYNALEALKEAKTGTYLAPLRLLALEVQEKINLAGIPCDLRTGEEEILIPGAKHSACTVEKLDLSAVYDVCVIDECQLLQDAQRGWAWTQALLGVQAHVIYICVAPEALDIIKEIITDCGDSYEVIEHTRLTPLIVEKLKFNYPTDVKKGDALVAFSKKQVLEVATELSNIGIKPSILYGALPYATRKQQVERFLNGETECVVCTDCIGMGLNLPIQRVIFLENSKYDGIERRELNASEIKQIAGRAGRRGMYKNGYVTSTTPRKSIANAIKCVIPQIQVARLGFPDSLSSLQGDIIDILKVWSSIPDQNKFVKTSVERTIALITELTDLGVTLPNDKLLAMANIPFDEKIEMVLDLWKTYCLDYCRGVVTLDKPVLELTNHNQLEKLEVYYKCLDMYYSCSKTFSLDFDNVWLAAEKLAVSDKINTLLITNMGQGFKVCKSCGTHLHWDSPFNICDTCYAKRHV